ncbi:hypothetical protein DM860_017587 [Cuscuta australis]|uniref:Uncharacterized protein n=1 Tax=Cuscuta australis TaxID=267555 RepID=A0A328D995_9ASTE|nr:hypothetical protein DM860_017587 [Cuscuta australis]
MQETQPCVSSSPTIHLPYSHHVEVTTIFDLSDPANSLNHHNSLLLCVFPPTADAAVCLPTRRHRCCGSSNPQPSLSINETTTRHYLGAKKLKLNAQTVAVYEMYLIDSMKA